MKLEIIVGGGGTALIREERGAGFIAVRVPRNADLPRIVVEMRRAIRDGSAHRAPLGGGRIAGRDADIPPDIRTWCETERSRREASARRREEIVSAVNGGRRFTVRTVTGFGRLEPVTDGSSLLVDIVWLWPDGTVRHRERALPEWLDVAVESA